MILVANNKEEIVCNNLLLTFSEVLCDLNPDEKIDLCFSI